MGGVGNIAELRADSSSIKQVPMQQHQQPQSKYQVLERQNSQTTFPPSVASGSQGPCSHCSRWRRWANKPRSVNRKKRNPVDRWLIVDDESSHLDVETRPGSPSLSRSQRYVPGAQPLGTRRQLIGTLGVGFTLSSDLPTSLGTLFCLWLSLFSFGTSSIRRKKKRMTTARPSGRTIDNCLAKWAAGCPASKSRSQ